MAVGRLVAGRLDVAELLHEVPLILGHQQALTGAAARAGHGGLRLNLRGLLGRDTGCFALLIVRDQLLVRVHVLRDDIRVGHRPGLEVGVNAACRVAGAELPGLIVGLDRRRVKPCRNLTALIGRLKAHGRCQLGRQTGLTGSLKARNALHGLALQRRELRNPLARIGLIGTRTLIHAPFKEAGIVRLCVLRQITGCLRDFRLLGTAGSTLAHGSNLFSNTV